MKNKNIPQSRSNSNIRLEKWTVMYFCIMYIDFASLDGFDRLFWTVWYFLYFILLLQIQYIWKDKNIA